MKVTCIIIILLDDKPSTQNNCTQLLLRPLICVISILGLVFGEQVALKLPFSKDDQAPHPPKVAIIGAGIAGASAAYHLHDQYAHANLDVIIYQANSQVGGRIISAKVYDGAYYPAGRDWCAIVLC